MADIEVKQHDNSGKVRAKKASTKVDMTPLADLGFLLITCFMFTTTVSKPSVMGLNMPPQKEKNDPIVPPKIELSNSLTFILGKANKLYWHQQDQAGLNI